MKISIITVVYNGEKTIERTLKSVIREKGSDSEIEYIIIDGKSTDNTMEIIDRYRNYVDVCISEKDFGIADALNKGLSKATGDYYILVAADDELLPGSIKMFKANLKEDIDVWCGGLIYLEDGYYKYEFSSSDLTDLYKGCTLWHPATFFKKDTVDRIGKYDVSLKIAADRDIFIRLYLSGAKFQIENIPIVLFDKRGISNTDNETVSREDELITMKYAPQGYAIKQKDTYTLKIKRWVRKVLVFTHTYKIIMLLLGRSNEFVSREDLVKYGLK